jgi:hypothetical protein
LEFVNVASVKFESTPLRVCRRGRPAAPFRPRTSLVPRPISGLRSALGVKAATLALSVSAHTAVALVAAHGGSPSGSSALAGARRVELPAPELTIVETPSLENLHREPVRAEPESHRASHTHPYPVAPDHDVTPHDPSVPHIPLPGHTADRLPAPPPAVAHGPSTAPARFVLTVGPSNKRARRSRIRQWTRIRDPVGERRTTGRGNRGHSGDAALGKCTGVHARSGKRRCRDRCAPRDRGGRSWQCRGSARSPARRLWTRRGRPPKHSRLSLRAGPPCRQSRRRANAMARAI